MLPTFTNFAVIGAGNIGSVVVNELLKKKLQVTILTRDDTKPDLQDFKSRGATLVKVDYNDRANLTKALGGVEVVITALGTGAHTVQEELAHAAKAAGVQMFVPTEYGVKKPSGGEWFYRADAVVRDLLREIDLPYTIFHNGVFCEYAPIALHHDYKEGTVQIVGDGKYPMSVTSNTEIGVFVAHAMSTAAKEDLAWATIPFEGERTTPLQMVADAEKKLGKKMEVTYVSVEENKKLAAKDFNAAATQMAVDGYGVSGTDDEVAAAKAKFFPEWNPTPYAAFIQ